MTVLYVDLSHHDVSRRKGELPDWARIRGATSPVMCARATYGDPAGYNPPSHHFRDLVAGARRAGFTLLGAYHNLIRGDQASINRQVDYLRREMDAAGANWAMLDVERYPELVSRGLQPRFNDAMAFCARWRAVDKRALAVYLPRWIWDGHMGRPDLRLLRAPLVASNYGSNPDGSPAAVYRARGGDTGPGWNAYGGVVPTIWQYGSNIDCPGASGQTDVNAFRGSLAELAAVLNPAAAAAAEPKETDVSIADAIAALETIRPYQGKGPRLRLKDPQRFPPKGWADLSARMLLEYLFEGSLANGAELGAAKLRQEAILAKLDGESHEEVLARIDAAAAADKARHEELVAQLAAEFDGMRDLVGQLGRGEIAVDEFVRVMGERLAGVPAGGGAPEGAAAGG